MEREEADGVLDEQPEKVSKQNLNGCARPGGFFVCFGFWVSVKTFPSLPVPSRRLSVLGRPLGGGGALTKRSGWRKSLCKSGSNVGTSACPGKGSSGGSRGSTRATGRRSYTCRSARLKGGGGGRQTEDVAAKEDESRAEEAKARKRFGAGRAARWKIRGRVPSGLVQSRRKKWRRTGSGNGGGGATSPLDAHCRKLSRKQKSRNK